jgi:hypothetical protein
MHPYKQSSRWRVRYRTLSFNRLPEDDPSGSKHVEDIINNISLEKVHFLVYIVKLYICNFSSFLRFILNLVSHVQKENVISRRLNRYLLYLPLFIFIYIMEDIIVHYVYIMDDTINDSF